MQVLVKVLKYGRTWKMTNHIGKALNILKLTNDIYIYIIRLCYGILVWATRILTKSQHFMQNCKQLYSSFRDTEEFKVGKLQIAIIAGSLSCWVSYKNVRVCVISYRSPFVTCLLMTLWFKWLSYPNKYVYKISEQTHTSTESRLLHNL